MTPEQEAILAQLDNVHLQIYELIRQAEQLRAAMSPPPKKRKPIKNWKKFMDDAFPGRWSQNTKRHVQS